MKAVRAWRLRAVREIEPGGDDDDEQSEDGEQIDLAGIVTVSG